MSSVNITATVPASADVTVFFVSAASKNAFTLPTEFGTPAVRTKAAAAATDLGFTGALSSTVTLPGSSHGVKGKIVLVGVGAQPTHEDFRRAAGAAARAAFGAKRAAFVVTADHTDAVGAITEGAILGSYAFTTFKGAGTPKPAEGAKALSIVTAELKNTIVKDAFARATALAEAVNRTRDLANTPPGHLPPAGLADAAAEVAGTRGLDLEIWDEKALKKAGFGGIIGVGQGSANPPRLIRIAYRPEGATRHIAIVGKGITFDTGGISIKPALGMHEMKADMSGAAAVIQAIAAIADLGLNVNVTAFAACAENMPSGSAQRPGDVVTAYGGRTVEVLNTDAEGRLVLMDALVKAQEEQPDILVDVATLTGAAVVALGHRIAAVLSPNDDLRNHIVDAASRSGESMWPMPLPAEYRKRLDSSVADIANIADAYGSCLYGGLFLQDFVAPTQKWAHLDIAAPAYNSEGPYDYTPKGATGSAVRTLVTLAEDLAAGIL